MFFTMSNKLKNHSRCIVYNTTRNMPVLLIEHGVKTGLAPAINTNLLTRCQFTTPTHTITKSIYGFVPIPVLYEMLTFVAG